MNATAGGWNLSPALTQRLTLEATKITWTTPARRGRGRPGHRSRVATLRKDSARVEEWGDGAEHGLGVDASPLGALVLLDEVVRRGPPDALGAHSAGRDPLFPDGAIVAIWGTGAAPDDERPGPADLVGLVRFAFE